MNINNGKDLQSARIRAGITQAEVAEYLGYNSKGQAKRFNDCAV